ncbi:hypothetical protein F511_35173 [Dorcoceras hygrometricum]|uniref:Uncharacterized protein n=1 Tax=Dorcoceras hygrometricum TaxID=472368 RepID=A0A2Z7ADE2_9LAMI|nr:hypothetical protein F511_35173 [Dorcoceras hygrometricum]
MRIRPTELETSICDVKYQVSLIAVDTQIRSTTRSETPSSALEVLTRSARTDSPRKTRPEQIPAKLAAAAVREGREAACA